MRCNGSFLILVLAASLFVVGCTTSLRFKTVDAKTGQPIAGVTTTYEDHAYDLLLGSFHFGPTNLPPSTDDGVVVVRGVHKKRVSTFDFSRQGYRSVQYAYAGGRFGWHDGTNSIVTKSGEVYKLAHWVDVLPTNGWFVIQMDAQ
jgi:hypothetical protein